MLFVHHDKYCSKIISFIENSNEPGRLSKNNSPSAAVFRIRMEKHTFWNDQYSGTLRRLKPPVDVDFNISVFQIIDESTGTQITL